MKSLILSFQSLISFLSIIHFIKSYSQSGVVITDLDTATFQSDLASWSLSASVCPTCSKTFLIPENTCGLPQETIYGGPNILGSATSGNGHFFQRDYSGVAVTANSYLALEFDLWVFTDATINTNVVSIWVAPTINGGGFTNARYDQSTFCPMSYTDAQGVIVNYIYRFKVIMYIQSLSDATSLSLKITNKFVKSPKLNSFGIKNVKIYMGTFSLAISQTNFPCANNYFWDGTQCWTCHPTCKSCTGPNSNQCTICAQTNNFLYNNGSCLSTCTSPFTPDTTTSQKTCQVKCTTGFSWAYNASCIPACDPPLKKTYDSQGFASCSNLCSATSQFLYQDGNCYNDCPDPLNHRIDAPNLKYCMNPCQNSPRYLYPDQSCKPDCLSPLRSNTRNNIDFCENPCNDPTLQFLFHDGSCLPSCNLPLKTQIEPNIATYCQNPCYGTTDYLYPDQSCKPDCLSPLRKNLLNNVNTCENPCNDPTKPFLFHDGACLQSCDLPLVTKIDPNIATYCQNPCYGTDDYLYPDSSCQTTCPSPLSSKTDLEGNKYCFNPCAGTTNTPYLYEDKVCRETCKTPSILRIEPIAKFCKYPCKNLEHYYFEPTGKCQPDCEFPFTKIDSPLPKICQSSLTKEEIEQIKDIAKTGETANSVSDSGVTVWNVISSSDSTAACLGPMAKMLQYIKFMDIGFPEKVQLMFKEQSKSSGGMVKKMMKNVFKEFPTRELPKMFKIYEIPSSFFVNFWPAFFNLIVILFVITVILLLKSCVDKSSKIHKILQSLTGILKWNVFLTTFLGCFGDIIFFSALQLQTPEFEYPQETFSFLLCLLINTIGVYIITQILQINFAIRKSKQQNTPGQNIEQQWSNYRTLFEVYKDHSYYQQIFLFIFILRITLFNTMIGYAFKYPLFQAVILTLTNIAMLIYLIVKKPMKKIVNLLQQIILELILLPFNICVLVLAVMDQQEIVGTEHRERIGDVLVYINVIVPFLSVGLMAAKFIAIGLEFYKKKKAHLKGNNSPKLKEFALEGPRKMNTLDITQEKMPSLDFRSELSISNISKSYSDNTQAMDNMMENLDLSMVSHGENSLIIQPGSMPRRPKIKRVRVPHWTGLQRANAQISQGQTLVPSIFQGRSNVLTTAENSSVGGAQIPGNNGIWQY